MFRYIISTGLALLIISTSSSLIANENQSFITFTQKIEDDSVFWKTKEAVLKNAGVFNKKIFENSKKAFDTDTSILANEMDLDFNIVKESILFQKAFKKYLNKLRNKYPNKISSFYFERVPEQKAYLKKEISYV